MYNQWKNAEVSGGGEEVVVGRGWVEEELCAHKEQYPGASQQATETYFFHLWGKTIHYMAICWSHSQWKKDMGEQNMWKCEMGEGWELELMDV